jgi:hypothetical protein
VFTVQYSVYSQLNGDHDRASCHTACTVASLTDIIAALFNIAHSIHPMMLHSITVGRHCCGHTLVLINFLEHLTTLTLFADTPSERRITKRQIIERRITERRITERRITKH